MDKKAQINQVFTFLIVILIVGAIAIMGYSAFRWIIKTQCEQQRISFERSLLIFIDEYSDKGSIHEEVLKAPCDVYEVCFIDSKYYEGGIVPSIVQLDNDGIMKVAVDEEPHHNIFVRTEFTEPIGFSRKVALKPEGSPPTTPYFKCFKVKSGKFRFLFTGLGRKTQIETS